MNNSSTQPELRQILLVEPPRVFVDEAGIVMRTVAEYINDDNEAVDLGIIATGPAKDRPRNGRSVIGYIGKDIRYQEEIVDLPTRVLRRVSDAKVQRAEEQAAITILSHLGLTKESD